MPLPLSLDLRPASIRPSLLEALPKAPPGWSWAVGKAVSCLYSLRNRNALQEDCKMRTTP